MSAPSHEDLERLRSAIALSRRCPPSAEAFSVGCLIVAASGETLAEGHSRRADPREHAEEAALSSLDPRHPGLAGATLYSSLEPCSARASRPASCTDLILALPIARIVFAWREPLLFVDGEGAERLRAAGREVLEVPELAEEARAVNHHLPMR